MSVRLQAAVSSAMLNFSVLFFTFLLVSNGQAYGKAGDKWKQAEEEMLLSEQVLRFLEHFQQEDPVGLPGVEIPDPFPIPDMKKSFAGVDMVLTKIGVRGLNKLKIISIHSEMSDMKMYTALKIDHLLVEGHYVRSTWLTKDEGPFTVNLTSIFVESIGTLGITRDGELQVQDINMDINFKHINLNFENLNFFANMVQGFLNSMGIFIFNTIKPYILKEAYTKITTKINSYLHEVAGDMQFPNSISPLDMVVVDVRKKIRDIGYDPYRVKDRDSTNGLFHINLSHMWLTGLSTVHRMGNISLNVENSTLVADFEIGTQKLEGRMDWSITSLFEVVSKSGTSSFSIEFIRIRIILAQPFDTRQRPKLRGFLIELGNVQIRCDGAGTLDYMIEFGVNVFPNLLRYQIVDAIQLSIIERLRKELEKVDMDALVKTNLPELDQMKGITLSSILATNSKYDVPVEDDFFKF